MEDELETEGLKGEFDRKQASKSLASTLNKLIDKLDPGKVPNKGDKEQEPPPLLPEEEDEGAAGEGNAAKESPAQPPTGTSLFWLRRLILELTH